MREHSIQHHGGLKCTVCDNRYPNMISFVTTTRLNKWERPCPVKIVEKSSNQKHIICAQCGNGFADPSALSNHGKKVHDGCIINVPTNCPICGKVLERYEGSLFSCLYTYFQE